MDVEGDLVMFGSPVIRMNPAMIAHFRRLEADRAARGDAGNATHPSGPMTGPPGPMTGPPVSMTSMSRLHALRPSDADTSDEEFGV